MAYLTETEVREGKVDGELVVVDLDGGTQPLGWWVRVDETEEGDKCTCCGGAGEHTCGHECYACDAGMTREAQAEGSEAICPGHHGVPDPDKDRYGPDFEHDRDSVSPDEPPEGTPYPGGGLATNCVKCNEVLIYGVDGDWFSRPDGSIGCNEGGGHEPPAEMLAKVSAAETEPGDPVPEGATPEEPMEEPTHAGIAVQATDTGRILMIQRSWDETDPPEVRGTWEFPGGTIEEGETPEAAAWREFSEETGLPQPDGETTDGWRSPDGVYQGFLFTVPVEAEAFEEINPDAEAADTDNPDDPGRRNPDITAWFTVEQAQGLGAALRPEVAAMDWSIFGQQAEDAMTTTEVEPEIVDDEFEGSSDDLIEVPWHGVLAPEGVPSGDGRMFGHESLRFRDLPLPLTWQKVGTSGHDGRVTVGRIDRAWREDGVIKGEGVFLLTPEADEVIALIAAFGKFGVSVDADDVTEVYEDEGRVVFADARVASACIVDIPAFMQAFVALGPWAETEEAAGGWGTPSESAEPPEPDCVRDDEGNCIEEEEPAVAALMAGGMARDEAVERLATLLAEEDFEGMAALFADVAPGRTEDGPGWLTHPVDTDRLRDYWVRGPGAAKINWGAPGDFNRCRSQLAKYVKPQYLSGYCANRHKDALGIWPGEHNAGKPVTFNGEIDADFVGKYLKERSTKPAPALSLVASAPKRDLPGAWFKDPEFTQVTPITITEEGQFYGHLAQWGVCHIGFDGVCIEPPKSKTNYAYFRTGLVHTTDGPIEIGNISMGGGHAGPNLRWRAAMEHYDSTSSVIADVVAGEDEFGIWVAGAAREGVTPEQIAELHASGGLSGDWREVRRGSGDLELVAALAVNVGGFPVPRLQVSASGGHQTALVAAGVVAGEGDPVEEIVDLVVARLEERQQVRTRLERLREKVLGQRAAAIRARLKED